MKSFTVNSSIIKDRHYYIDFDYQIQDSWQLLSKSKSFSVIMPPSTGKTTLLLNLQTYLHRNTKDLAFYMDFSHFNRNAMSTFDKFLPELKDLFLTNAKQISNAMVKLVETSPFHSRDDLISFLNKLIPSEARRVYLFIDNADKHLQHDTFSVFLGLMIKKMKDMQERNGYGFHAICVAGAKKINNFIPYERGLDDGDFFHTWDYSDVYSKAIEINEASTRLYLAEYTTEIGFDLEPSAVKELHEKSQGLLLNINKILKFFDEKVRPFKKQKLLTIAEIQHAAGYVFAPTGPRR